VVEELNFFQKSLDNLFKLNDIICLNGVGMDLIIFIGALAAFIILHELGHFLVALWHNVEIEEFGIGFPPRLFTLFRWHGVDFTLNLIPLGGFVRPKGENDASIEGGLAASPPNVRLGVILAGPMMNILIAILLYSITISRIGIPQTNQVIIVDVAPESPAAQAGLQINDLLIKINQQPIQSIANVQKIVAQQRGKEITLTIQRDNKFIDVQLIPRLNPPAGQGAIGIAMSNPSQPINLIQAFPYGTKAVIDQGYLLLTLPFKLLSGNAPSEEMRVVGFKGMYDIYQGVRDMDATQNRTAGLGVMAFFAMISASLGILNLLPIPALDGGRILFILPELILNKRIPSQFENAVHLVGFMLLLVILLYVNLQDFINPINLNQTLSSYPTSTPLP